jgi:hypothetical protein
VYNTRVNAVKPVNLTQLLSHTPTRTLSFFFCSKNSEKGKSFDAFYEDMLFQLESMEETVLLEHLRGLKAQLYRIIRRHPTKTCGFFFSDQLSGYIFLDHDVDPYFHLGPHFHVRPLLEQTFVNPEFILINVSFYDLKIYRGDFQHLEIVDQFEFDQIHHGPGELSPQFFAPQFMGLIPYKTILALKNLSRRLTEKILYESVPVVVTGLADTKAIFLQNFEHSFGVISHLDEDFYEKTCVEILERCLSFRHIVADYYHAQFKERLKRLAKSPRLLTELSDIVKATAEGRVIQLVLPTDLKVWGFVNFDTGKYELQKRVHKNNPSVDILNELAEEVLKQGGRIQVLSPKFFPENAYALAILKGSRR